MSVERELANEIGAFLSDDSDVAKINFFLGATKRIYVTGKHIKGVGEEIKSGRIRVEINDAKVGPRAGARFFRDDRCLVVKKKWLATAEMRRAAPWMGVFHDHAAYRSLAVHEAVHAIVHTGGRRIVKLNDEAAAYIAQVLYLMFNGTFSIALDKGESGVNQIMRATRDLIQKHRLTGRPGAHLTWDQTRPLRRALKGDGLYDEHGWLERY